MTLIWPLVFQRVALSSSPPLLNCLHFVWFDFWIVRLHGCCLATLQFPLSSWSKLLSFSDGELDDMASMISARRTRSNEHSSLKRNIITIAIRHVWFGKRQPNADTAGISQQFESSGSGFMGFDWMRQSALVIRLICLIVSSCKRQKRRDLQSLCHWGKRRVFFNAGEMVFKWPR